MMNTFDGIIFDVDGTIWDSTPVVENAWNAALEAAGYEERVTAKRLQGLFGLPMEDIIQDILPWADDSTIKKFAPVCYKYEDEYLSKEAGIVYDGFEEMLNALHGKYPMYIVSNCQAGYIELMLEKTGFGKYFNGHLCPGDTGLLKADNIRKICADYGLTKPVYIGDTQMDANACKDAGVPIIFASYGFGSVDAPYKTISSPMELVKLL